MSNYIGDTNKSYPVLEAFWIKVIHLFSPLISITQASEGVFPSRLMGGKSLTSLISEKNCGHELI